MRTRLAKFLFAAGFCAVVFCNHDRANVCAQPAENLLLKNTPKPKPVVPPSDSEVEDAIRRGVDFLLQDQNKDGSWGSATRTKGLNIYAPIPGAHHAFRAACSSLAVSALVRSADERPEVHDSIRRGEEYLQSNLTRVRRATPTAIYNVWTHSYAIEALVDLLGYENADAEGHEEQRIAGLKELIRGEVRKLEVYESAEGGWGYYDFRYGAKQPSSSPNSFTSATGLLALFRAKSVGIEVPEKLILDAVTTIQRQRNPDFTYHYAFRGATMASPRWSINRPGGSLGRSQVCNLALRLAGDEAISDEVLDVWLDRLFARNGWLSIGRKRPIPHESHFLVAGYFYYYGHWYAARTFKLIPEERRLGHQQQMARLMVDLQEKDGSWWDYPLYAYGQPYGTSMGIMTLKECQTQADDGKNRSEKN